MKITHAVATIFLSLTNALATETSDHGKATFYTKILNIQGPVEAKPPQA